MLPHEDKSLPRIIRNILARDHYELTGPKSSYQDQGDKDRLRLEIQLADAFENLCPFWGMAIPYDGRRGSGIDSFIQPRRMRYAARYNLELAEGMRLMYGSDERAKKELVFSMASEFIAEIEKLIGDRDLKFYPCITARPMCVVDATTFEPTYQFDAIFYLSKGLDWTLHDKPPVPVTEPSKKFIAKYAQHLNDPIWPTSPYLGWPTVSRV